MAITSLHKRLFWISNTNLKRSSHGNLEWLVSQATPKRTWYRCTKTQAQVSSSSTRSSWHHLVATATMNLTQMPCSKTKMKTTSKSRPSTTRKAPTSSLVLASNLAIRRNSQESWSTRASATFPCHLVGRNRSQRRSDRDHNRTENAPRKCKNEQSVNIENKFLIKSHLL